MLNTVVIIMEVIDVMNVVVMEVSSFQCLASTKILFTTEGVFIDTWLVFFIVLWDLLCNATEGSNLSCSATITILCCSSNLAAIRKSSYKCWCCQTSLWWYCNATWYGCYCGTRLSWHCSIWLISWNCSIWLISWNCSKRLSRYCNGCCRHCPLLLLSTKRCTNCHFFTDWWRIESVCVFDFRHLKLIVSFFLESLCFIIELRCTQVRILHVGCKFIGIDIKNFSTDLLVGAEVTFSSIWA